MNNLYDNLTFVSPGDPTVGMSFRETRDFWAKKCAGNADQFRKNFVKSIRERAREDFVFFMEAIDSEFIATRFHKDLSGKLVNLLEAYEGVAGRAKMINISAPPRHGKSQTVAKYYAAWCLGRDPSMSIVITTRSRDLASDHLIKLTDRVLNSDKYKVIFPEVEFIKQTSFEVVTKKAGGILTMGITGMLSGRGADLLIIDDPFKDAIEASKVENRDKVWSWFQSVAATRLSPKGVLCVIMTRWHEDDLVGRLTDEEYSQMMREISSEYDMLSFVYPAECENPETDLIGRKAGEFLTPERFSEEWYNRHKFEIINGKKHLSSTWNALFQQNPVVEGDNLFSRDRLHMVKRDEVPNNLKLCRFWDLAAATSRRNDFSVGALCGYDKKTKDFWILDVKREKLNGAQIYRTIGITGMLDQCPCVIEGQSGFKSFADLVATQLKGRVNVKTVSVGSDKLTRAMPWLNAVNLGKVHVVIAPWNNSLFNEVESFPVGTHDDQVDAISGAYSFLVGKGSGGRIWSC